MKKLLSFLLLLASSAFAEKYVGPNFTFLGESNGAIYIRFNCPEAKYKEVITPNGIEKIIYFDGATPLLQASAPDLYKFTTSLIIPDLGNMEVNIVSDAGFTNVPSFAIPPSKGNLKRNVNPADIPYTYGSEYSQNSYFPANIISMGTPYILRDYRALALHVCPVQYNPITKQVNVFTELTIEIKPKSSSSSVNEFNRTTDVKINDTEFDAIYNNLFLDYSAHKNQNMRYTAVSENGSMLVVCYDAFASDIQPFITWKNKKGIETDLVLTSQISNSITSTDIKNYIANYYSTHPTLKYVLLVGDAPQVPASSTQHGDSDNDYGYLSGNDSYSELFIGRFSATTSTEVQIMVNRTLRYEQFPTHNSSLYKKRNYHCFKSRPWR